MPAAEAADRFNQNRHRTGFFPGDAPSTTLSTATPSVFPLDGRQVNHGTTDKHKQCNSCDSKNLSEKRRLYSTKLEHYRLQGKTLHDPFLEDVKSFRKYIIEENGSFFGFDWMTKRYFSDPIQNQTEVIDLAPFTADINYYPDSKNLNLASTLVVLL